MNTNDRLKKGEVKKHAAIIKAAETEAALLTALEEYIERTEETELREEIVDLYLAALDEAAPLKAPDTAASLNAFYAKHAALFDDAPVYQAPAKRRKRVRPLRLAVAVMAAILGLMVIVQASGVDVFGAVIRWTGGTFSLSSAGGGTTESPELSALMEALEEAGAGERLAPTWIPEGFELTEMDSSGEWPRYAYASYVKDDYFITIQIDELRGDEGATYEQNRPEAEVIIAGGIEHFIVSNNKNMVAVWRSGGFECSIGGNISTEEIKKIIESIYE